MINRQQTFIADDQATEITQPSKSSFDLPSAFVAFPQLFRLFPFIFPISSERDKESYASAGQGLSQLVRIVSLISNQIFGSGLGTTSTLARDFNRLHGFFCQSYFRWRSRGNGASQRNTLAVDHHQPLRAFPPLSFPDCGAPFFAGAKLASMKASCQSSTPSLSNWERKVRHTFNHTSCSVQRLSRRQQVDELGYLLGKSFHGAPVRKIRRIPSSPARLEARGRPPLGPGFSEGSKGAIFAHCSSVRYWAAASGSPPISLLPEIIINVYTFCISLIILLILNSLFWLSLLGGFAIASNLNSWQITA